MKSLMKLFWIFILGSILGCIVEEIWCLIKNKVYQIRKSLIYSPMIPIYGVAASIIVVIAYRVGYDYLKIFFIGMLVTGIVEYISSYFQEKIFHTKSWDYSKMSFNLNGRINLLYLIAFGVYSVLFIKQLTMIVNVAKINTDDFIFSVVTFITFILFSLDVIVTLCATYRQKERRKGIKARNEFEKLLDEKYNDERLNRIYNNSVYTG